MSEASEFYDYKVVPIDIDQGVAIRTVGPSLVYMYKSMPGLYLNQKGGIVDDELARKAGFPIEEHRAAMRLKAEIRKATQDVLRRQADAETEARKSYPPEVLAHLPRTTPLADVPNPDDVAPELFTDRTKDGKPRGTKDFVIAFTGKDWAVYERETRKLIEDKLTEEDAIEFMVEAQHEVDGAEG